MIAMTNSYGDHDERLIEDIHPPDDSDGFNTRQAHVRRQAIGDLEERYLRQHSFVGSAAVSDDEVIARPALMFRYTRVPPLALLDTSAASLVAPVSGLAMGAELHAQHASQRLSIVALRLWRPVRRWFVVLFVGAAALAESAWRSVRAMHIPHLARKYSVTRGVYIDWLEERRLWQLKWALFPLTVAIVLFLIVVPLRISTHTNAPKGSAPKQHAQNKAQLFNPVAPGSNAAGNQSALTGSVSPDSGAMSPNSGGGATATTGSAGSVSTSSNYVGLGGGSTTGTVTVPVSSDSTGGTTTTSGSSSSTPSTPTTSSTSLPVLNSTSTVSVPPLSASTGDKQLVSTSGTSLTLN